MKIGIDATSLSRKITGIENYTFNLCKTLLSFDKVNSYVIFFRKQIHHDLLSFQKTNKFLLSPYDNQIFCEQFWLPYIILKEKLDVVHFPAFPPGLFVYEKCIITLHDATMWKHPCTLSWKNKIYMKPLTILALKKSEKIITVSESSKKDIITYCNVGNNKIINTGESISEKFMIIEDKNKLNKVRLRYNLPDKYILAVSSIEPRKNIESILQAYSILKSKNTIDYKLVLVGRKAWGSKNVQERVNDLKINDDVVFTDYIGGEDLICVYNMASLFVYPSFYEGFGLPPLEAMACGAPVLASDIEVFKEVLGDAAILVSPTDVKAIANNIYIIMNNHILRNELKEKGLERVKSLSWEDVAKKTIGIYESIC